jgi:hypothetical protein
MDENQFWALIANARASVDGNPYEVCNAIEAALAKTAPADIIAFHRHFYGHYYASYRADLWGAAFIMNGGCSDDGFDYFRGWLIVQGRSVFEAAVAKPDSLATYVADQSDDADFGFEDEDALNVANRAWKISTAQSDDDFYAQCGDFGTYPKLGEFLWSDGDGDVNESAAKRMYPKLWKKFG